MRKENYLIGIDEVGRGALAGPVVVAAVAINPVRSSRGALNHAFAKLFWHSSTRQAAGHSASNGVKKDFIKKIKSENKRLNKKLKLADSKKLTALQREKWAKIIKDKKIPRAIAGVSPKIIDKINISNAANLAATKALKKLITRYSLNHKFCNIFLDGGLYINKSATKNRQLSDKNLKTKTIIKGDEKIPAISLASIVAKVYRDKLMKRLHKKYPHYDFINNVGYGTKKHLKALNKFGYSKIHRKSFSIK